jgi:hypothetical protein
LVSGSKPKYGKNHFCSPPPKITSLYACKAPFCFFETIHWAGKRIESIANRLPIVVQGHAEPSYAEIGIEKMSRRQEKKSPMGLMRCSIWRKRQKYSGTLILLSNIQA